MPELLRRRTERRHVLEFDERHAGVLSGAGEVPAGQRQAGRHGFLLMLLKVPADLAHHLARLLQGGAGGQHGLHEHDALILVGQVRGGHALEQVSQGRNDQHVDEQVG